MAIDNERLAACIVAMYTATHMDGGEWTDTDELIQEHAFQLWERMTWDAAVMAIYLFRHGWSAEAACSFANDIPEREMWTELRYQHEKGAR